MNVELAKTIIATTDDLLIAKTDGRIRGEAYRGACQDQARRLWDQRGKGRFADVPFEEQIKFAAYWLGEAVTYATKLEYARTHRPSYAQHIVTSTEKGAAAMLEDATAMYCGWSLTIAEFAGLTKAQIDAKVLALAEAAN